MEIERKWLVDVDKLPTLPEKKVAADNEVLDVVQGYLNTVEDEWLIRVRSINDFYYFLELKTKGHLKREELCYWISKEEFDSTLPLCRGGIVRKTRYILPGDGFKYEIDFYKNHDFVTCEVEFKSEKEANEFIAPDWCSTDVTHNPFYKNVNLAK